MRTESRELLAVGIFGRTSLGDRMELLLKRGREFSPRVSPVRLAASVAGLLMCVIAGSLAPRLIAFTQKAEFEVASVKPNKSGEGGRFIRTSPGRLSITNMTLKNLMTSAYHVRDFQIFGGPNWIDSDRYDVDGKPPANTVPNQMAGPMLKRCWKTGSSCRSIAKAGTSRSTYSGLGRTAPTSTRRLKRTAFRSTLLIRFCPAPKAGAPLTCADSSASGEAP